MAKYLTKEGLENLKKELGQLEKQGRKEIAERLKHAISFGDLSENAAYSETKEAQGFLEGRISELKGIISSAKLIDNKQTEVVQVGSIVTVRSEGKNENFQIVGAEEVDIISGKISHQSPLGKGLIGKKKGDIVLLKIPAGQVEYKIIEIK